METNKNLNTQHVGYESRNKFLDRLLELGKNNQESINPNKNELNNINNKKCKYIIHIIYYK